MQEPSRSNSAFPIGMGDLDLVVLLVRAKVAATAGVALQALEPLQILHYAPGQTFEAHYDFLDPAVPGLAIEIARAGQRKATFLIYLNDEYEGGATDFPLLDLAYRGRTGDALMFANLDASGQPARDMLHAGLPPTAGEKWLFSQWIRER
jgi:prolyl 4-hydroxylase